MNKKFKFIIVSKDTEHQFQPSDFENFSNINVQFVENNKVTLPKLYNEILKQERKNKNNDFVIFMHGDVKFDINHFLNHLIECADKYDLFGLCGTEVFCSSKSPLNWYTSSNPTPEKRWGCVTHGELKNRMSYFSSHHSNILDHEVACIDGLCIIFGKNALNANLWFDENMRFDCYDTQISLSALIECKLKIGVIVEMSLQHYSVGKQILNENFLQDEYFLRKHFGFDIPEKIQQLSSNFEKAIK